MTIILKQNGQSKKITINNCSRINSEYKHGIMHLRLAFKTSETVINLNNELMTNGYIVYRDFDNSYYYVVVAHTENITFEINI